MDLAGMRSRVRLALKDLDATGYFWSDEEVDGAIERSLGEYSRAAPGTGALPLSGDGESRSFVVSETPDYLYALAVEYPLGSPRSRWPRFREAPAGTLLIAGDPPAAGAENLMVWYARGYAAADAVWTVPAEDLGVVELGAVAMLARSGARYASGRLSPTGQTPVVLSELAALVERDYREQLAALSARPSGPEVWARWGSPCCP